MHAAAEVRAAVARLREFQARYLAPLPAEEIVLTLDAAAREMERWLAPSPSGTGSEPPPPAFSPEFSLHALLASLRRQPLLNLLEEEFSDPALLDRFVPSARLQR
ncbi:MAG: hypothetical protein QHJ73_17245, partial [Armatimonadota bacterium]|nr:hypothetical protein [Armatimonadota bacterium]